MECTVKFEMDEDAISWPDITMRTVGDDVAAQMQSGEQSGVITGANGKKIGTWSIEA